MKRILSSILWILTTALIVPMATAADPITIAYSNVTIDKTSISTGQSVNVTFDMRSTGVPVSLQPDVFLELVDQSSECEEECGSSVVKQVSGNISQGKWAANVTVGTALPSGTYRIVIFMGKLKGVKGALYYDNRALILTNTSVPNKPAADPITITYSNVTIDKTAIGTGQSINVTFDMRSTGVPAGLQPTVFLELTDQSAECEEECGSSSIKQVSGNIAQGKWAATVSVGTGLPSGIYRVVIFIPKLKGVNGALYYDNRSVILTNSSTATKPSALPITIVYSNVVIDKTSISTGQSINVTFDMRSTGVPAGLQPNVFLEVSDQSSECEEECGSSVVKQVSGSISQGKWAASITAGSGLPSGTYRVVIFVAKLKGVNGALYYDNRNLILTNTSTQKNPITDPNKKNPTETVKATPKPTQSVASTSKASTITCVKDKLTKKVTGVKPVCPAGYKSTVIANVQHEILINSFQWSWQFTYLDAGKDVKVIGTEDKSPTMVIPLGERVRFTIDSKDVIHGFWIPEFMIQVEARPGLANRLEFTADKLGDFKGRCNILCGRSHSQMLFTMRVVTPAEYKTYLANLKLEIAKGTPTAAATPTESVTSSPTPSPTMSVTPTPTPSATNLPTVSPGAFCSPAGATGKSTSGVSYTCKTSPTDTRNRWRQ